jgi:tetratricopeptide (TPR) repeat protein
VTKLDDRAKKRQLLKEKSERHKKPEDSAKLLNIWLSETETSVDLAHIFQSLEDNRKKLEQLPVCSDVIAKFTHKACQTNRAMELLQAIEQLLQDYQEFGEVVTAKLYFSKYYCLKHLNNLDLEAEYCLHRVITLSREDEKIEAYFVLASYYEDISEYQKMKHILIKCQLFCTENPLREDLLARTLVLVGHYYFRIFNFYQSQKYFEQAQVKLELLCKQQTNKMLLRTLSECLHYLGRIYFEKHNFIDAANFFLKSQSVLEQSCQENNLTLDVGATAFYHLRLGQVLEASQLQYSAKYHFDECRRRFNDRGNGSSTLVHVNLALANLIKNESRDIKYNFQKEEEQLKDSAKQALAKGYSRGYLMALVQLLSLYKNNIKLHLLIKVVWDILVFKEFYNLGGIFFLISYIHYKLYIKFRPNQILLICPCPDPKCKIAG